LVSGLRPRVVAVLQRPVSNRSQWTYSLPDRPTNSYLIRGGLHGISGPPFTVTPVRFWKRGYYNSVAIFGRYVSESQASVARLVVRWTVLFREANGHHHREIMFV
jgi:hypothetical protein